MENDFWYSYQWWDDYVEQNCPLNTDRIEEPKY